MENKVKKLIGYTPMQHQIDVHKIIKDNPKGVTISVLSRRQSGKTLMVENILLDFAINKQGTYNVYIGPTFKHCKKAQSEIKKAVINTGCLESSNETTKVLKFKNGSIIQFFSAEQKDNLRGDTVTGILIYDEAVFIKDEIFDIADHFCNVHNSPILMVSTPMRKAGRFYECFERGQIGIKGYKSIDWKDYDLSKLLSKELIQKYKMALPASVYNTEVLGEFIDGDSVVFESYLNCVYHTTTPVQIKPRFVGIDWATESGTDYTVLTYMDNSKRVLYQTKHKEKTTPLIVQAVIDELNMYSNLQILSEATGIGRVYNGFVIGKLKNGNKLESFETSNNSKREIIEALIVAFQNNDIEIPNDEELLKELDLFGCTYNPKTQTVKYAAVVGNDDRVMSLAFCYYKSKQNKGNYTIIVI